MVAVDVPAVGVPDTVPLDAMVSPAGRLDAVQVYGGVPPCPVNVNEYGVPFVALGGFAEVIAIKELAAIVTCLSKVVPWKSVTRSDVVHVPGAVKTPIKP